jgi:hypothetical protein
MAGTIRFGDYTKSHSVSPRSYPPLDSPSGQSWPTPVDPALALDAEHVAVTDPAALNPKPDMTGTGRVTHRNLLCDI